MNDTDRSLPRRRRRDRARDERGAAAVEFALLLLPLLLLTFGIIEFGRAYNTKLSLTHAAREGVRVVAVTGDAGTAQARAQSQAPGASVAVAGCAGGGGGQATVTVTKDQQIIIPLWPGSGTFNLSATAAMTCG